MWCTACEGKTGGRTLLYEQVHDHYVYIGLSHSLSPLGELSDGGVEGMR